MPTISFPTPPPSEETAGQSVRIRPDWDAIFSLPDDDFSGEELSTVSAGVSIPVPPSYRWNQTRQTIEPIPSEPIVNQGKWPIGTIVKWNVEMEGVAQHVKNLGRTNDNLLKILAYTRIGELIEFQYINDCEPSNDCISDRYFIPATVAECCRYEQAQAQLQPCTVCPAIGTVLEYISLSRRELKGKKGVVISHYSEDRILFHWFNNVRSDEVINYQKFKVAQSQRSGFTLTDADIARDYSVCDSCASLRLNTIISTVQIDHQTFHFCDNYCAERAGYGPCNNCYKWLKMSEDCRTYDGNMCPVCIGRHYIPCDNCNTLHNRRGMIHNEIYETYTCVYCNENQSRLIHSHGFKPRFSFQKMAWENTRYLGIELEIECPGASETRERIASRMKEWLACQAKSADVTLKDGKVIKGKAMDKLVYFQSDGSLNNGIEICWHPFTLKSFHRNFPLKPFLAFLQENKAIVKHNCGMHVHVSKDRLSVLDLIKGKWFFHKCAPYLKKFSDRQTFDFCKFDPYPPGKDPHRQEYGHYSVLNINPAAPTLEVRIFNATLDYKKFLANLQFADVFVDYIQHGPGIAFLRTAYPAVIWQDFIDYAKHQNRYQVMTSWILTKAIV